MSPDFTLLQNHFDSVGKHFKLDQLFKDNANRFTDFSIQFNDIFLDFSKNLITEETLRLLVQLAKAQKVIARKRVTGGWVERRNVQWWRNQFDWTTWYALFLPLILQLYCMLPCAMFQMLPLLPKAKMWCLWSTAFWHKSKVRRSLFDRVNGKATLGNTLQM